MLETYASIWYCISMSGLSYDFSFARRKETRKKILIVIASFIAVSAVLQLILMFLLCPLFITSSSMEPEIGENSAVFILPLGLDRPGPFKTNSIERGSIVYISSLYPPQKTQFQKAVDFIFAVISFQQYQPYENLENSYSELYRVVGFPGDTVYIEDFVAYIRPGGDSHFLTEFELSSVEYDIFTQNIPSDWDMSMGSQGNTKRLVLKRDEYFLLCDNRLLATDSRLFGPIKKELISGRALLQYFPLTKIGLFP